MTDAFSFQKTLAGESIQPLSGRSGLTLYAWQDRVYDAWKVAGCKGTLVAPFGAGKTIGGLEIILKHNVRRADIVVPFEFLKNQWENEIRKYERYRSLIPKVHVWVANTASKLALTTDLLVVDEAHRVTSPMFSQVFANWKYPCVLGITGTSTAESIAFCGPVFMSVPWSDAKISAFNLVYHLIPLTELEQTEYARLTKRITNAIGREGVDEGAILRSRDESLKRLIMLRRTVAYNAANRIPKVVEIVMCAPQRKTLIVSERIEQADSIHELLAAKGVNVVRYHSKHAHESDLDRFRRGQARVMSSAKMLQQGFDVRDIEVVVMASVTLNPETFKQIAGRGIRFLEGKVADIHTVLASGTGDTEVLEYRHQLPAKSVKVMYAGQEICPSAIPTTERKERDPWFKAAKFMIDREGNIYKASARGITYFDLNTEIKLKLWPLKLKGGGRFGILGKTLMWRVRNGNGSTYKTNVVELTDVPRIVVQKADFKKSAFSTIGDFKEEHV